MLPTLSFGLAQGIYSAWSAMLSKMLSPLGYGETDASWIGFSSTLASIVGGVVMGVIADKYPGRLKLLSIISLLSAGPCFIWMALVTTGVLGHSLTQVYVAACLGGALLAMSSPVGLELAVELTY